MRQLRQVSLSLCLRRADSTCSLLPRRANNTSAACRSRRGVHAAGNCQQKEAAGNCLQKESRSPEPSRA